MTMQDADREMILHHISFQERSSGRIISAMAYRS